MEAMGISGSIVLAADDPAALARFYEALLEVQPQPGLRATHWRVPWPAGGWLEIYAPPRSSAAGAPGSLSATQRGEDRHRRRVQLLTRGCTGPGGTSARPTLAGNLWRRGLAGGLGGQPLAAAGAFMKHRRD